MNSKLIGILICSFLIACTSPSPTPTSEPAHPRSMIFFNGAILTMDHERPQAQAIVIQDSKIIAVGENEETLAMRTAETLVIDLNGLTLMPGFVDAHTHIFNDARSQGMSLDEAQALALRNGVTTLGDLFIDRSFLREIQDFDEAGLLRVRTGLYLVYNDPCGRVFGDWYNGYPATRERGEMLRVNGVKVFTDGGACGGPALSFELQAGEGLGDLWMSQEELNEVVIAAQSAGYQVAIHAIGDRAVEQAQNALASALNGQPNTYRHRMEHVSVLQPEMIQRFGELGIIPVLPGQYHSCAPFGPPLPEKYGNLEWPWKELREHNPDLHIAWHSDFPFWSSNPFVHLYGFVTRRDVFSYYTCSPKDWLKDDTISVEQDLSIMTIESAYALFREEEVGSVVPGKYADVIILSENPLTVAPEKLKDIKVLATLVNGQFEYCDAKQSALCPGYSNRVPAPLPDTAPPAAVSWLIAALIPALPVGVILLGRSRRESLIRFAGVAAVLSGIFLFTLYWVLEENPIYQDWVTLSILLFISISAAGMTLIKKNRRITVVALLSVCVGAIIAAEAVIIDAWLQQAELWTILLIGAFILFAGMLLFGIVNLRARIFARLNGVPLATTVISLLIPLLLSDVSFLGIDWSLLTYMLLFGSGWLVMGILLLLSREP